METVRSAEKTYSADALMLETTSALLSDFRAMHGAAFRPDVRGKLSLDSVPKIRHSVSTLSGPVEPSYFKAMYQFDSLWKRHRFSKDTYSDAKLEEKAINSFIKTQERLQGIDLDSLNNGSCDWVLDYASAYIAKALGPYDDEEHRRRCRFGKKASVGVPARNACEAARWELPITGSQDQIAWFDSEMSEDCVVQDYLRAQQESDPVEERRSIYQVVTSLKLTLVPKTFKSLRAIMPNTTIGGYMSHGLGEMLRIRLKRIGYNIRTLQERHKMLAKSASIHNQNVTADLSSASDSITEALVQRLFPPDWYDILVKSRIGVVVLPDNSEHRTQTFCTMGIGYTFPLQTLVFLSLLKGVEALLFGRRSRKTISVYGDDMIYSHAMHETVVSTFSRVGFVINLDKTFDKGSFRESCGGDYYHGVDVRPFQPESGQASLGRIAYEAILYKYVNGLLARWTEYEVERTLHYLLDELSRITSGVKLVPCDYPVDSGIQCSVGHMHEFLRTTHVKVCKPVSLGHGLFRFSFLRFKPLMRKEVRHGPFYWAHLRGGSFGTPSPINYADPQMPDTHRMVVLIERSTGVVSSRECLLVTKDDKPTRFFRSIVSGRRFKRQSTYVTISHTGRYTRQSGVSCFETRR